MRMSFRPSFSSRLLLLLLPVLAFSLGLAGFLIFSNFRTTYENLVRGRLTAAGSEIRSAVEVPVNLGLTLGDLSNLPSLIQRSLAADPTLAAIRVIDMHGMILAASDAGAPKRVSDAWLVALRRGEATEAKALADDKWVVAGLPVRAPYADFAGAIIVAIPKSAIQSDIATIRNRLLATFFISFLSISILLAVAVYWATSPLRRTLGRLEDSALAGAEGGRKSVTPSGEYAELETQYEEARKKIEDILGDRKGA